MSGKQLSEQVNVETSQPNVVSWVSENAEQSLKILQTAVNDIPNHSLHLLWLEEEMNHSDYFSSSDSVSSDDSDSE